MQSDPVVLKSGADLRDAATKRSVGGYHALPVTNPDHTLVGIVTSSDLFDHLLRQIPSGDGSIRTRSILESVFRLNGSDISTREFVCLKRHDRRNDEVESLLRPELFYGPIFDPELSESPDFARST